MNFSFEMDIIQKRSDENVFSIYSLRKFTLQQRSLINLLNLERFFTQADEYIFNYSNFWNFITNHPQKLIQPISQVKDPVKLRYIRHIKTNMSTSEQIYAQLKQHGLVLSEGTQIILPPILPPKPSLLGQLTSYIVPEQDYETEPYEIIIVPVLNNCFLIARSNTLICYKYELDRQSHKPLISRPQILNLKSVITNIHICDPKYLSDRGEIPFLIQHKNELTLYYLDLKMSQFIQSNSFSYTNIISVKFTCEKQVLVLSSSGNNRYLLHHCYIQNGKLKEKTKFNPQLEIPDNQILKKIDIAGNIDEEQQSTVCIFYFSILKQIVEKRPASTSESQIFASQQNSQVLRVKQLLRDLQGKISAKKNYLVISTKNQNILPESYQIKTYNSYFSIVSKQQILIVKKKFQRYLFIDNVIQKVGGHTLTYHQKGIVTSHNGNSMELNVVFFNDPKCYSKLLDSIEISQQLEDGFMILWPFKTDKQVTLMFVFRKEKRLVLSSLIKMDAIEKMIFVVQNSPKEKIPLIQQIALNLGISKKDFYVNQWIHSKRQLVHIHQFLLHCGDISTIKKQLRSVLRKKKTEVFEFIKILEKLSKIIKSQLQLSLSQNLLIEYLKNDFLLRKIKLKEANWKIDFKELDRIYNSSLIDMFVEIVKDHLYPEKEKQDPLHAMVPARIKQDMSLKHVFQVFRIPILYQYNQFLIKFVSEFSPDQIVNVFRNYSYLLPIYQFNPDLVMHKPQFQTQVELQQKLQEKMYEKPNIQEQQFSNITSVEFSRQMTKQRLQKQLHNFYPTSKISQALTNLMGSDFGTKMQLHKHGLITCGMVEYREKLKQISGIKLYLKLCEFVNEYNLGSQNEEDNLSKQLVEILRENNNLEGQAYEKVRLFTQLHRFMLQNNFFDKKKMSTEQLVELSSQDLVAVFFLQNKQRKQFIFRQFRDIFIKLYQSPVQFNRVIEKFINSENCSRIELQIFIHEIKNHPQPNFQYENQQLIEIIIDGYCQKLQLRQENDTQRFLDIMQEVQLRKKLTMKINKIYKIRQCFNVFVIFNCEKQTYYKVLKYEQNNEIFRILLERYFEGQLRANFIRIDDEDIPLEYCRNMLTVLLYLQDSVYYDVTQRDLLLIYCEVLIEWKQYEVILGVIHQQHILQQLNIEPYGFITELVNRVFDKMYKNEQILFSEQTKQHIHDILAIYQQEENDIIEREGAKLELGAILQSWGTDVHLNHVYLLMEQWKYSDKQVMMNDLIKTYIDQLDFKTFYSFYFYLNIACQDQPKNVTPPQNSLDFINFSLNYAQKLLQKQNYQQIATILAFVKSQNIKNVSYSLVSQTFLKLVSRKYTNIETAQQARQVIEYFTQHFEDNQEIKKVFEQGLDSIGFKLGEIQRDSKIVVNPNYCFRRQYVQISIDMLWEICMSLYVDKKEKPNLTVRQVNLQNLYYCYYYLLMIFCHPQEGFKKSRISYSLELLTQVMFRLQSKIEDSTHLWCINVYSMFKKYSKSLYIEGLYRIQKLNPELYHAQLSSKTDQSHLEVIKVALKEDRQKNIELLKCISKVQNFIIAYKAVRKMEKQTRLEKIVLEQQRIRQQKQRQQKILQQMRARQQQESNQQLEQHNDQMITISLKKFNYLKSNLSMQHSISGIIHSQKQLLHMVYTQEKEQKKRSHKKIKTLPPNNPFHVLLPTYLSKNVKQSLINTILQDIKHQEWPKLTVQYQKEDLVIAAQRMFFEFDTQWKEMVNIMAELNIMDSTKASFCKLCSLYLCNNGVLDLTSEELKRLIPFSYLIQNSPLSESEAAQHFYTVIYQQLSSFIQNKSADFIRDFAISLGSILNNNSYIPRFCMDVLLLLNKNSLQPETIIRISTIVHLLKGYPQEVKLFANNILQAFSRNRQLLVIIKQELLNILRDSSEDVTQIEKFIRDFGVRSSRIIKQF